MEAPPPLATIKRTIANLAKNGVAALVAVEEEVIGCAGYQLITTLQHPIPLGRVTLLIVAGGARRRGVGTALLEQVEARLRKAGCGIVEIVNDIELSNANSFLRGHDYQRSGYRFARDIGK
jgi:ribosomal protein S18 acetylase RimI-like enzyme